MNRIKCTVTLTGNKEVYRRGEEVSGTAVLDVPRKIAVKVVRIYLFGELHIRFIDTHGTQNVCKRKETYCEDESVYGFANEERDYGFLKSGQHEFHFLFNLPDTTLPSSFESEYGSIRYWIWVKIKTRFPYYNRKQWYRNFTVVDDIDVNDVSYRFPVKESKTCTNSLGTKTLASEIDRGAYCAGEIIALSVDSKNHMKWNCSLWAELVQEVSFKTESGTNTLKTVISKTPEVRINEGQEIVWGDRLMKIAAVPPSTLPGSCDAIVVSYCVRVRHGPFLCTDLPLTIGTVPYGGSAPTKVMPCRRGYGTYENSKGKFVRCSYTPMCVYVPNYVFIRPQQQQQQQQLAQIQEHQSHNASISPPERPPSHGTSIDNTSSFRHAQSGNTLRSTALQPLPSAPVAVFGEDASPHSDSPGSQTQRPEPTSSLRTLPTAPPPNADDETVFEAFLRHHRMQIQEQFLPTVTRSSLREDIYPHRRETEPPSYDEAMEKGVGDTRQIRTDQFSRQLQESSQRDNHETALGQSVITSAMLPPSYEEYMRNDGGRLPTFGI